MKAGWIGIAGAVSLAVVAPGAATAQVSGKVNDAIASTVRVLAMRDGELIGQGTGWVVAGPDNEKRAGSSIVVTSAGVTSQANKIVVIPAGRGLADVKPSEVIYRTSDRDIAFVAVKGLDARPITLTDEQPASAAPVFAAGFASTSDNGGAANASPNAAIKDGRLSRYFEGPLSAAAAFPVSQIAFEAATAQGYAGGPLLNECGLAVGLQVKDAGSAAVAASELVKAAYEAGVGLSVSPEACGSATAQASSGGTVMAGMATAAGGGLMGKLRGPVGLLVVGLVGLAIAVGAAFFLFRRKPKGGSAPAPRPRAAPAAPSPAPQRTGPAGSSGGAIRLSGSGPNGEPISMRFQAGELGAAGVVLGVEGDGQARIPDTRPSPYVSRRHARLFHDGQKFMLEDNKSSNGTFVGGQRLDPVKPRVLMNGDHVRLADIDLAVAVE